MVAQFVALDEGLSGRIIIAFELGVCPDGWASPAPWFRQAHSPGGVMGSLRVEDGPAC